VKPNYTQNNDLSPLTFPKTYQISSKRCIVHTSNIQYFIRDKSGVLNFTFVKYSLHKCTKTIRQ